MHPCGRQPSTNATAETSRSGQRPHRSEDDHAALAEADSQNFDSIGTDVFSAEEQVRYFQNAGDTFVYVNAVGSGAGRGVGQATPPSRPRLRLRLRTTRAAATVGRCRLPGPSSPARHPLPGRERVGVTSRAVGGRARRYRPCCAHAGPARTRGENRSPARRPDEASRFSGCARVGPERTPGGSRPLPRPTAARPRPAGCCGAPRGFRRPPARAGSAARARGPVRRAPAPRGPARVWPGRGRSARRHRGGSAASEAAGTPRRRGAPSGRRPWPERRARPELPAPWSVSARTGGEGAAPVAARPGPRRRPASAEARPAGPARAGATSCRWASPHPRPAE